MVKIVFINFLYEMNKIWFSFVLVLLFVLIIWYKGWLSGGGLGGIFFWGGVGVGVGVFCNEFFFMFFLLNKIMKISNNFF